MISPRIEPGTGFSEQRPADLLVLAVTEGNELTGAAARIDLELAGGLSAHLATAQSLPVPASFEGGEGQVTLTSTLGKLPAAAVMVVGLGSAANVNAEQVRRAAGLAARYSGGYESVVLDIGGDVPGGNRAAAEGFQLGSYVFDRYLSSASPASESVVVAGATPDEVEHAAIGTRAAIWARDLVNEPPSNRGPAIIAEQAADRAEAAGLQVEIFDEVRLEAEGMNGILTVGRGSTSGPRLAVITYDPPDAQGFVGLVGKGITFDSGGLSLKSGEGMMTMKADCAGGAAVLAAVTALPELAPPIKVVAAVALAENMPSGGAVKPGDVIRHRGGKTSEVLNTDAEGRLVLADTLAWMSEQGPDAIVDLATLTGAASVALGRKVAGLFCGDAELAAGLKDASAGTGEPVWELPLVPEYRSLISSTVADVRNIGKNRYAGAITAALFLKEFVDPATPWAHIDMAGPAWSDQHEHYLSAGATGFGTRLLIEWIERRAGKKGTQ